MNTMQTLLAVASIAPDIKTPDIRDWLNFVYITPTRMIASDGRRCIILKDDFSNYTTGEEILIPVKIIYSLAKKLGKRGLGAMVTLENNILSAGREAEVISLVDMEVIGHHFHRLDEIITLQKNRPVATNTKFNWHYMASMQKAMASIAKKDTEYFSGYSLHISDSSAIFTMGNTTGMVMAVIGD